MGCACHAPPCSKIPYCFLGSFLINLFFISSIQELGFSALFCESKTLLNREGYWTTLARALLFSFLLVCFLMSCFCEICSSIIHCLVMIPKTMGFCMNDFILTKYQINWHFSSVLLFIQLGSPYIIFVFALDLTGDFFQNYFKKNYFCSS